MTDYFMLLDQLIRASAVVVDRRRGSVHPRFPDVIYPLDYGHLANTTSDEEPKPTSSSAGG